MKRIKTIAWFLSVLMPFQSCSSYTVPVSMEEAARQQTEVKIVTEKKDRYKFNQINFEDGQFYGVNVIEGEKVTVPINPEEIISVKLKNKGMPMWAIVVISVISGAALLFGILWIVNVA